MSKTKSKPCAEFVPLVNGGDYRGEYCCVCGEKEVDHKPATVWNKWECDHGARWTTVKDGICQHTEREGAPCFFSGCAEGHTIHFRGTFTEVSYAHDWFKRPDPQAKSTH